METDLLLRGNEPARGKDPQAAAPAGPGDLLFGKDEPPPRGPPEDNYGYKMLDDCIGATSGRFQHFLAALCALANFVDAAETMMLGLLYPTLAAHFNLREEELALIASLTNAGMFVGAVVFGKLSDVVGRKSTFVISMLIVCFFGLVSSFADDIVTFSVLRMFLGVGYGGNLITGTTLLVEFVSHSDRGMWVVVCSIGFGIGALSIAGISWAVIPSLGWQWLLRIAAFMAIPAVVLLYWVPESPRFYIMTHDFDKCVSSMEYVARFNGTEVPPAFTAATLRAAHHEPVRSSSSWRECWGMNKLLRWPVLRTLLPLAGCWFLNAFAYVINNWLPIHGKAQFPLRDNIVYEIALIQAAGLLCGTIFQLSIVYYFSRLLQLRSGFALTGASVLLLGFFYSTSYQSFFAIAFVIQFFEQLIIGTLYLYTPEAFPTALRVTAFGVCQANHRIAPIIAPYVVAALDAVSFHATCMVFGSLFFMGFVLSLAVRVTTFNRPLVEESDLGPKGLGGIGTNCAQPPQADELSLPATTKTD